MKTKTKYKCSNCGKIESKWMGRCSQCGEWNSFEEFEDLECGNSKNIKGKHKSLINIKNKPTKLSKISTNLKDRIVSSYREFNQVMGGGVVKDSITILSAPPGMGKSTLLLMIGNDFAKQGLKVLYITGEESETQIKSRADRILDNIADSFWIYAETNMNKILSDIEEINPNIIIGDSIQTFYLNELSGSRPGSPSQITECANCFIEIGKNPQKPVAIILTGQMNKTDEMAGPRILEHAVDTVLYLEGDRNEQLRTLISIKNRFGNTDESGLFKMDENGMNEILNPSEFFITERESETVGTAITVTKEGSRNIITEVESLVSKSFYGYPARMCEGIRKEQLQVLIAILEQRAGKQCGDKDVVVKVTGGLKLKEPSVNLGVIMSIVSSIEKKAIPLKYAFIGDVGLTGEIKNSPGIESRIKELEKCGFEKVFISKLNKKIKTKNIEIIETKNLRDVILKVFNK